MDPRSYEHDTTGYTLSSFVRLCFKTSYLFANREVKGVSTAPVPAPAGDAHSSLMAAIRQAGGAGRAKLRSASESTPQKVRYIPGTNITHSQITN